MSAYLCVYFFPAFPPDGYDKRSNFKCNLPSPRLVVLPRLNTSVCPTIYTWFGRRPLGFIPFLRALVQTVLF